MVDQQIFLPNEEPKVSVGEITLAITEDRPFGDAMAFTVSEEFSAMNLYMQYSIINTAIDLFKNISNQLDREIQNAEKLSNVRSL